METYTDIKWHFHELDISSIINFYEEDGVLSVTVSIGARFHWGEPHFVADFYSNILYGPNISLANCRIKAIDRSW
jgi:hypothetical protein